jgi:thiamine-phosphate pyrophosphorylase
LNRAIEAARVLEDLARFVVDDRDLALGFKEIRHSLAAIARELPSRFCHRDAEGGDVGAGLIGARETSRASLVEVTDANASRLTEALRSVEECLKVEGGNAAQTAERLRYRAYTLGAALHIRIGAGCGRQWRVCLLLTRDACRLPWRETLAQSLAEGTEAIQVREKSMPTRDLADHVREVVAMARPAGAVVIVNDRLDVALAANADGVHLGSEDLSPADARRCAARGLIIGATAHSESEAARALREGADYIGIGPAFASPTKPGLPAGGVALLDAFLSAFPDTAHLAIGGITPTNIHELVARGCRGVAVSSCVLDSSDPGGVVRALREAMA